MRGLRTEIIRDPGTFEDLEPCWWQLWGRSISATPFQSPAWLIPWWRTFAPGDLTAIAVWSGDELAGLAPLYIERHNGGQRLLPIGISLSDYLDILSAPELEAETEAAIAEAALSLEWSQWILPDLSADAISLSLELPNAEERRSMAHAACPVLLLDGDRTLARSVPARRRRQLRRAERAARRRGAVIVSRGESDPQTFLDRLIRLHGARWTGHGGGVLSDTAVEFHRRALPRLADNGLARCLTIQIDDAVVGAYYGFHHRDRAYAYLGGFDPAYAGESPGAILIGHAITGAASEGALEFDFLRGREGYKYGWGAKDRWTAQKVWTRSASP
ncbi:GNAT family N-acetyltransferase [Mesorhizobium sp. B2-7-2]|uniref:GNAT family N-acetyltransferase n=1 Tax=Mesorhizobium sp. B2-7-2 TaxID=2589908 RepID=UPI0011287D06|nr:GNAT family N-acetyltransferase [Mesorhizobium sp. B2-7-2]TPJ24343.1 GNAT family N-acetyltransferase [Mesorhizobium sp. B2-7-2]